MTAKPKPSFSWELLDKMRQEKPEIPRPEGCIIAAEYAERYKVDEGTARVHLKKLVKQGKMVEIAGKMRDRNGDVRNVTYYRLK